MSDGPHKSLNMRRGWQRLSERADNNSFAPGEVSDALLRTLEDDWHAEIPQALIRQILDIFTNSQISFFPERKIEQLEALRRSTGIHPLGGVLLDCSIQLAANGRIGAEAARDAACMALLDRATRGARQVEEHYRYHPESTPNQAMEVKRRIEAGTNGTGLSTLAARLMGNGKAEQPRALAKQTGLDEGVSIG